MDITKKEVTFMEIQHLLNSPISFADQGSLNISNTEGHTPLHVAVKCGDLFTAQLLIEQGADTNFQDKRGITPLDIAIETTNFNIVLLLLKSRANTDKALDQAIKSINNANDKASSIQIICLLIRTGEKICDMLCLIEDEVSRKEAKKFKEGLYRLIRETNKAPEMPHDQVRCFLNIVFKVNSWKHLICSLPMLVDKTIDQLSTTQGKPSLQEEPLLRLIRLEIHFKLLNHLRETLGSDIPTKSIDSIIPSFYAQCIDAMNSIASFLDKEQNPPIPKNIVKDFQEKDNIGEFLKDEQKSTKLFETDSRLRLFKELAVLYSIKDINALFSQLQNPIVAEYVESALPKDLKQYFETEFVRKAIVRESSKNSDFHQKTSFQMTSPARESQQSVPDSLDCSRQFCMTM